MNSKVFSQNALLPSSKLIERKHILKIWWRKQQSRWPKTQGYGKSDNGQKYLYFWHIRLCKFSNTSQHELDVLSSFCCMAANTAGKAEQDRALHIFWVTGRRANKKPDSTVIACSHCSVLAKPHKHWEVEWRRKHLVWWREQEEMDKDSMLTCVIDFWSYLQHCSFMGRRTARSLTQWVIPLLRPSNIQYCTNSSKHFIKAMKRGELMNPAPNPKISPGKSCSPITPTVLSLPYRRVQSLSTCRD